MKNPQKLLEIIIITHNRSSELKKTLLTIFDSAIICSNITVLDNFSNDETQSVCADFLIDRINFTYIRNINNIGAEANIMRAYEIATADYLWLICDDDELDFTNIQEIFTAIEDHEPDLIIVGGPTIKGSAQSINLQKNILIVGAGKSTGEVAYSLSFLPSTIIKTKKLKAITLAKGYELIHTFFPQYYWIGPFLRENWPFIITKQTFIQRPNSSSGFKNNFLHINGYMKAITSIRESEKISMACETYFKGSWIHYVQVISISLIRLRAQEIRAIDFLIEHIYCVPHGIKKITSIFLIPLSLLPVALARIIIKNNSIK